MHTRWIVIAALAGALTACPPVPVTALQVAYGQDATSIASTPPSRVFLPGDGTGKWLALAVPSATSPPMTNLPSGITAPSVVELRGWLTEADTTCNGADPDWHWGLTPDPAWADAHGINLNTIITAGNINVFTPTKAVLGTQQPVAQTNNLVAGLPVIHIELNGVSPPNGTTPPTTFDGPIRPSSDWGFSQADPVNCPGVSWAFNPPNPLSWQSALKVNQYVRIVGSLVTDEPHAGTGELNTWFLNNFGINVLGPAGVTTALQANWQTNHAAMDPQNPARWVEIHPPDIISVLNDVDANGAATNPPVENVTGVTVYSGGCAALCSTTNLDVTLNPPGPQTQGTVQVMECVGPETNFQEIVGGAKGSNGNFVGATITVNASSARVQVSVQGQPAWGAPGKFKAIYRVGWKGQAPASAPPGCTMH